MILAAFALALVMECELPAWLVDQAGAIRDSADAVVDATVIGLRYAPDPAKGEVEALLEVHRSWRESVPAQLPVLIHTFECGPELRFGGFYVIGLKHREGSTYALAAVPRWEADSLIDQLGGSQAPERVDDEPVGSLAMLAAIMILLVIGTGVYVLLQRRAPRRS